MEIIIRDAVLSDAKELVEIYDHYVKNTAVSFEYETPNLEEFQRRMKKTMESYPYLVVLKDGKIAGYAYAGPFVGRAAYRFGCELTIYLSRNCKNCGLGRKLYEALEQELKKMGFLYLYACIGLPEKEDEYLTDNSAQFHSHLGFREVGRFQYCGYKFQRWYHMIWMEKVVGERMEQQTTVKKYTGMEEQGRL